MFRPPTSLPGFRRSRSSRSGSAKGRRARRFAPWPESLEDRVTLTGNIAISDISIVDSSENTLTNISAGEQVYVRVDFTTTGLASNASYRVSFNVNGLTLYTGQLTSGAGSSGTGNWNYYWGTFDPTPGTNDVTVIVDPDDSVPETSYADNTLSQTFNAVTPAVGNNYYSAAQIRAAYDVNAIPEFGTATPDGTGQTIAIVDAGNDPNILTDLDGFDKAMTTTLIGTSPSYYQQYGPSSSILSVYNESGQNITQYIGTSGSNGVPDDLGWDGEITLDVEWAHAIAPGAKIDLIESTAATRTDLLDCDGLGAGLPGVSVVSNSFDYTEFSGEVSDDSSILSTPNGHTGVTFLVSSGDAGTNVYYPSASPNAIAVGGTQLTLSNDAYSGETGWSFPTPRALDDGSSSYSQTGSWTSHSGGFSGTYGTASGGSSASATWSTTIATSDQGWLGNTEVSATWTAATNNATNATYTIYDGSPTSNKVLGTVSVDQTKAPVGTLDGNTHFQSLGVYDPSSGTLSVVLNANNANGTVVADAVGIAQGWSSTGGQSSVESEPSYQQSVQNTGYRTTPDVSFNGSDLSGDNCYEGGISGTSNFFGTSLSCPCWAGLIAIVDQGRVAAGSTTLNTPTNPEQAVQAIYSLPNADFHDITTGYNGNLAGTGYDEVTGRGSPIASLVVPDLVSYGLATHLVVTTQPPTSVTAGVGFGLTVSLEDVSDTVVSSYNGSVTLTLANNPGGGSLGGTLTVTAVNGVATFSGLTLDKADVGYQIEATGNNANISAGTTNFFNVVAGSATQLVLFAPPPSAVTAGNAFGLTVAVEDSYNNVVTNDKGSVTLALLTGPTGSVLGGTLTEPEVGGEASFANLTLNKVSTGDTLSISRPGLPGTTSGSIAVNVGTAAKLAVIQQAPTGVAAGVGFGLEVAVEDASGNIETTDGSTSVTATLASGSGPLLGMTTITDSGGFATFNGLADDKAETISLRFLAVGLSSATSNQVVVSPSTATQLVIHLQPSSSAFAGQPFATQPVVYEEDQYGNLETGDNSTVVTATLASGSGPLQGTNTAVVKGGVATFTSLLDKKVETISIGFSGPNLSNATSNTIVIGKATPTLTWSPSAATATYKQSITLNANVAATIGGPIPTGSVTFLDGSTILGSSTLNSKGQATLSTASLPLGSQPISVKYSGDSTYAASTSSAKSLYVGDLNKNDFDGDGKSDIAIYDQTSATFYIAYSGGGSRVQQFGNPADKLVPLDGDYDGDGKTDLAIYDQTTATFYVLESRGGIIAQQFGNPSHVNIPIAGDFDGDGKTDLAIYDQSAATFYVLKSGGGVIAQPFGNASHVNIPIAGDFDGDGKTDLALYDQSAATFYVLESGGGIIAQPFGNASHVNVPVAGDFDGDGKTDLAIYDQSAGVLYALESGGGSIAQPFGSPADAVIPLVGDFDGDGKTDIAIYDASSAVFFILDSDGGSTVLQFGNNKHANRPA